MPRYLIQLRTADGRYVGAAPPPYLAGGDCGLVAREQPHDVFEWSEAGEARIRLRAVSSGRYVAAHPTGGVTASHDMDGRSDHFNLVRRDDGMVAFRLADDAHYLTAPQGTDAAIGVSAGELSDDGWFSVEAINVGSTVGNSIGCSHHAGRPDEPAPAWKKVAHRDATLWGAHLLRTGLTPQATRFMKMWDESPTTKFSNNILDGLHDADFEHPWVGVVFRNHFYDPDSLRNYSGFPDTALTEGRRYFNLSVHYGMRITQLGKDAPLHLYAAAGFYLGLALHFLTDIIQPMHAANFANFVGGRYPIFHPSDKRHEEFEVRADAVVEAGYFNDYPPLKPEDLVVTEKHAGELLHGVAQRQKKVFIDWVKPWTDQKFTRRGNQEYFDNVWTLPQAMPALDRSLKGAPKEVARFLNYWATCIERPLRAGHRHWYKIRDARGRAICLRDGWFGAWDDEGDNALFFLMFNSDGTCSLACRAEMQNLWCMGGSGGNAWVGKDPTSPPRPEARFRFVPRGPAEADGDRIWIFEPTTWHPRGAPECLGVVHDAHLRRWAPEEEASQVYHLQPVSEIGRDYDAIRAKWPYFGDYPWFGAAE
ncbi:MAG: hypothetical protein ABI779_25865 [Acidobacteriota bacterium]